MIQSSPNINLIDDMRQSAYLLGDRSSVALNLVFRKAKPIRKMRQKKMSEVFCQSGANLSEIHNLWESEVRAKYAILGREVTPKRINLPEVARYFDSMNELSSEGCISDLCALGLNRNLANAFVLLEHEAREA